MSHVKAVIFDLDGVLIDLCETHREAFAAAYHHFTGEELVNETRLEGLPTRDKLKLLEEEGLITGEQSGRIYEAKQHLTRTMIECKVEPDLSKTEMLKWLRGRGIKVAVVTNSIRYTLERVLDLMQITSLVDFTVSNQDCTKSKPDPEPYRIAMLWLGVEPGETLILEDSEVGMESAVASGARVARVRNAKDVNIKRLRIAGVQ